MGGSSYIFMYLLRNWEFAFFKQRITKKSQLKQEKDGMLVQFIVFYFFFLYFGRQNSVCSKSVYRLPNQVEIPPVGRHLQKQQIDSIISSSLSA